MNHFFVKILLGCLLSTWALCGHSPALAQEAETADRAIAKVNGVPIIEKDFLAVLKGRYGERVLSAMIENIAIQQAAAKAGVTVSRDELEQEFVNAQSQIEMQAPTTGMNFEMWLASQNLTRSYFLTELYHEMLIEKMVRDKVQVSDKDVSDFYQSNKDRLRQPEMMQIAHIVVQTQELAAQIRGDIAAQKMTWEEAAKTYSLDPWTKDSGGDLGFMPPSADNPFRKTAFALKTNGEISQPLQTNMGWHLIKRLAYRASVIPKFEDVQGEIRSQLERRQLYRLTSEKREEIQKAAVVDRLLEMPLEPPPPAVEAAP